MGNWIVLVDEDDLAEQLDVVDNHIEESGLTRARVEARYNDNNDDRDSRAWLVRFALYDYANILEGLPDGPDPDLIDAAPPKRRSGARGKARKRTGFATVK